MKKPPEGGFNVSSSKLLSQHGFLSATQSSINLLAMYWRLPLITNT
jgi:hypothetical protein